MTDQNNSSQSTKRDMLKHDQRNATYIGRAQLELEEGMTGRYARDTRVTGVLPIPEYPAAANWCEEVVGIEPPTGYSIDAMPPVGEEFEIQASINRLNANVESISDVGAARVVDPPPVTIGVDRALAPNPKRLIRRPL